MTAPTDPTAPVRDFREATCPTCGTPTQLAHHGHRALCEALERIAGASR